jgi:hypothetical protein
MSAVKSTTAPAAAASDPLSEAMAKLAEAEARIVALEASKGSATSLRFALAKNGKGTISIYGWSAKWPLSMYGSQALRLAAFLKMEPGSPLPAYVKENAATLAWKPEKPYATCWAEYLAAVGVKG